MRIVSERNSGAGQVVMWAKKLLGIQFLKRLIVYAADGVAVGKH